ncbi:MAG TPA: hypothetical protein VNA13_01695 [Xanthomonadales bacterium]|nr:hypothetical protein [Xanthomonadales bacterium]
MPVIKFDYFVRPSIENKKLIGIFSPIVPIRLSAQHKMYPDPINCFVDSGADFNLMPALIGENLGLNIKKGEKTTHIGIGNVGIIAYKHPVKIFVNGYSFRTFTNFSYDHKIPILGRYGFFDHFKKVTFNQKKFQLELEH